MTSGIAWLLIAWIAAGVLVALAAILTRLMGGE